MDNLIFIILIVIAIVLAGILIWLIYQYKKLQQDFQMLSNSVDSNTKDIIGLCSAAVSVDTRVTDNNMQLKGVVEKLADDEQTEQQATSLPYQAAIQKVRNGASVDDLIQQCGLSREESVLLMRLHGNK